MYNELNEQARSVKGRAENVHAILNAFYLEPMLSMKDVCEKTDLRLRTVYNIINSMQDHNMIVETTGFLRNKIFMLKDYVDTFK